MVFKFSKWASVNKTKAQIILVFLHLFFVIDAYILGRILSEKDVLLSKESLIVILIIFLTAFFIYPLKNRSGKYIKNSRILSYSFKRHKVTDLVIAMCSFLLILTVSNRQGSDDNKKIWFLNQTYAADVKESKLSNEHISFNKEISNNAFSKDKNNEKIKDKKIRKSIFEKLFLKKNGKFNWALLGFILLIAVLGMAATFGISILACNIACSGNEIFAWILLAGGEGLIALLGVWAIKKFLKKQELKKLNTIDIENLDTE